MIIEQAARSFARNLTKKGDVHMLVQRLSIATAVFLLVAQFAQAAGDRMLSDEHFYDVDLQNKDFSRFIIREVDFTKADLAGADFSRATLVDVKFRETDLSRVNFSRATIEDVCFFETAHTRGLDHTCERTAPR